MSNKRCSKTLDPSYIYCNSCIKLSNLPFRVPSFSALSDRGFARCSAALLAQFAFVDQGESTKSTKERSNERAPVSYSFSSKEKKKTRNCKKSQARERILKVKEKAFLVTPKLLSFSGKSSAKTMPNRQTQFFVQSQICSKLGFP